ncbi:hypothetical protein L1987_63426 [Smallanthus sonchifolius]|uniref:Uncharacterized protein n=1 Tax=Smallanthus sonchifolius TaxID=185202 RepID=A0ACB9CD33_9ASTR|nr:hypothetical protein L1987_63426 [Smallanthus sonchifolius]
MTGFASLHARLLSPKPYRLSLTPLQSQNGGGFDDGVEEDGDCGSATARARAREGEFLVLEWSSKVQVIPRDSANELGRMVDRGLSHRKHALMNDLDKTLDDANLQMD